MKTVFGKLWIAAWVIFSLAAAALAQEPSPTPEAKAKTKGKEISAVVRIIRANPESEVFFKDYKESLIIPKDSQHNKVFAACEESRKKGIPVKLIVDPVSRRILGTADESIAASTSSDTSSAAVSTGSH